MLIWTTKLLLCQAFQGSVMRLFLDTADVMAWKTWLPTGLFYGVTTNPLLLERASQACTVPHLRDLISKSIDYGLEEVQVQTWGDRVETMVTHGLGLASDRRSHVVIKVPITQAGIQAATQLKAQGIRVTLTALYMPHQVVVATAIQADYAAPYLGRMQDQGMDGRQELIAMGHILQSTHSSTRLLVASIRNVAEIVTLATQGLDTFTLSPAIATALFQVEATNIAAADFERAATSMA